MELRWRSIAGFSAGEVFAVVLAILAFGTAGGAWSTASDHAVVASHFERAAGAPLYDLLAGVAVRMPFGEPWFRLGVANAVLGAALIVGIAQAARHLLPKDPVAAAIGAVLLAITPAFRDAAAFPGPAALASCGVVWTIGAALADATDSSRSRALRVFAGLAITIGAAPWLGAGLAVVIAAWRLRHLDRETLAIGIAGVGVTVILLWLGAIGSLPGFHVDLEPVVAAGRGSAIIVLGVGLIGAAFGAITGLRHARWLVAAIAVAAAHVAIVDPTPLPLLSLLAIGCAVVPSGIVRAVPAPEPVTPNRRHAVAALAALPLIAAGLLSGAAFGVDDPGSSPSQLASDLTTSLPPGPGGVFVRRVPTWSAIEYEKAVAGSRPDLDLVPPLDSAGAGADAVAATAIRNGRVIGSDVPAFGRLDVRFAYPRGRGFQLLPSAPPDQPRAIPFPATYRSVIGRQLATLSAVERARYEAVDGKLGAAARAAGLADRFGAADLAILSTTAPSRPAFFGFVPDLDHQPPGPWLIDLLGDDLAWTVGLEIPDVDSPRERVLHRLWRALWRGEIRADDPAIAALGPDAVRATTELVETFDKKNRR